jgi:hypothetical protein
MTRLYNFYPTHIVFYPSWQTCWQTYLILAGRHIVYDEKYYFCDFTATQLTTMSQHIKSFHEKVCNKTCPHCDYTPMPSRSEVGTADKKFVPYYLLPQLATTIKIKKSLKN